MRVDQDEALWYDGIYFSWGFGGDYNYFADKVRIGGPGGTPPNYDLWVSGTAGKIGSNTWDHPSDRRLKQDVKPYQDGLQEILAISPVTFHYNEASGFDTQPEYVGIIAQDLQEVAPYMVMESEDGYLNANTSAVAYMLVNAVKELAKENKDLNCELLKMQAEIDKLKKIKANSKHFEENNLRE